MVLLPKAVLVTSILLRSASRSLMLAPASAEPSPLVRQPVTAQLGSNGDWHGIVSTVPSTDSIFRRLPHNWSRVCQGLLYTRVTRSPFTAQVPFPASFRAEGRRSGVFWAMASFAAMVSAQPFQASRVCRVKTPALTATFLSPQSFHKRLQASMLRVRTIQHLFAEAGAGLKPAGPRAAPSYTTATVPGR